jgi:ribose transport system permease protein
VSSHDVSGAAAAIDRHMPRSAPALLGSTTFWIGAALLVLILGFGLLSEDYVFFEPDNLTSMALNSVVAVLLACGATYLLGAGLLDLSIGANLILSSVIAAKVMVAVSGSPAQVEQGIYPRLELGIAVGVAAAVAAGVAFGLVNALLVTRLRINSFIVTLATTGIGTGLALVLTNGINVAYVPREIQLDFGAGKILGFLPVPVILAAVVAAWLWFVLNRTRFGLYTIAIGSSPEAAARANVNVDRHTMKLFALMGALVGLAAIVDISRFGTTNVVGHQTDALAAIAAAVIGGTSLFGGRAAVGGTVLGALIPVVLATGLVILDVVSYYQLIVVGVIVILAVFLDQIRRRRFE